jgi:indolepyruvate ferredoxin oxidoreductase alpha subunit
MDNRITGMTGHQDNPGTGKTLMEENAPIVDLEGLIRSLGIQTVATMEAFDVDKIEKTLKGWLKKDEPAVLIVRDECALLPSARSEWFPLHVIEGKCNGCALCFRIGCPAIIKSAFDDHKYKRPLAEIDLLLCTGCDICAQICPQDAIIAKEVSNEVV